MKSITDFLDAMALIKREIIFWEENRPVDRASSLRKRVDSRMQALYALKARLIDEQLEKMDAFGRVDNESNLL